MAAGCACCNLLDAAGLQRLLAAQQGAGRLTGLLCSGARHCMPSVLGNAYAMLATANPQPDQFRVLQGDAHCPRTIRTRSDSAPATDFYSLSLLLLSTPKFRWQVAVTANSIHIKLRYNR